MYYSKYNILVPLYSRQEYSILQNLFHGKVSLIPRSMAERIQTYTDNPGKVRLTETDVHSLQERGFVFQSEEEESQLIEEVYKEFINGLPTMNPTRQYQILLTYDCNLRCVYCFQKKMRNSALISQDKLHAVFSLIQDIETESEQEIQSKHLPTRVPLISIVGGEPLRDIPAQRHLIGDIIDFAQDHRFNYSITTNGVDLSTYIPLFMKKNYLPKDIQVTLDGDREFNDKRRITIGGGGSFDAIVRSIAASLEAGMHLSLRINLDMMNLQSINRLADFILERGWHHQKNFSAYFAPITDHSQVNKNYTWLTQDATVIQTLIATFQERPELENMFTMKNFRGYNYVKRIVQKDGLPTPTIWRCEAVLGQMVFDPLGNLYTCFEGAGNSKAQVGQYFPQYTVNKNRLQAWKDLNAFTNRFCGDCTYRFVCASGCPWHIIGQGQTECLPIKEEINLAWNYYAPKIFEQLAATS